MDKLPSESVSVYGGIIRREFLIPADTDLVSHRHPYDHLSVLYSGTAVLTKDGETSTLVGPCMVEIKAGTQHYVHAITDCTWDCLHSLKLAEESHDPYILEGVS